MPSIKRRYYLLALVLFASIGFLGSVVGHGFIAYDDEINIYANRYVTTFSLVNLVHFWRGLYQNLYIPITYDLWVIVAKIAEFIPGSSAHSLNPLPFHAINLILHLGCTVLVFLIILELVGDDLGATAGALLFALHPLQVEALSWATGLKDVLCGFFSLLAIWQYVLYVRLQGERKRLIHYAYAGAAFVGALLSKPSAVALPLAVAVVGNVLLSRSLKSVLQELVPWLIATVPILVITKYAQPVTAQIFLPEAWQRFLIAGDAWSFYVIKFLCPWHLGPDYGRTPQLVLGQGWSIWPIGLSPYFFLALLFWRGNRFCRAAVGISLATLLPVSGFVSFDFQEYSTVADRYLYLAMVGPALMLGWLTYRYRDRRAFCVGLMTILVLLGCRSFIQVRHWQDEVDFYRNALTVNSNSWQAANNLGVIYLDRHELPEAARLFEQAISCKSDYAIAINNLGTVRGRQGQFVLAQELFAQALDIKPNYADAAANLGEIYMRRGEFERAKEYYLRALESKPDSAEVHANLGDIASAVRQPKEALRHYLLAMEYGPPSVKLLNNLGLIYKELGRVEDAVACFRRALSLGPDSAEVHNNLGLIFYEGGQSSEAIDQFKQAVYLSPDQPQPYSNLGKALLASGQVDAARVSFLKALSLNQGFAPAMSGLAELFRSIGRNDLATDYDRKVRMLATF